MSVNVFFLTFILFFYFLLFPSAPNPLVVYTPSFVINSDTNLGNLNQFMLFYDLGEHFILPALFNVRLAVQTVTQQIHIIQGTFH